MSRAFLITINDEYVQRASLICPIQFLENLRHYFQVHVFCGHLDVIYNELECLCGFAGMRAQDIG